MAINLRKSNCFWVLSSIILILSFKQVTSTHDNDLEKCRPTESVNHKSDKKIVSVYYPGYNAKYLPVEKIHWKMYDHIQYFVALPAPTPEADLVIETKKNMIQVIAGAKANNVSISLSIGSWTGSQYFSFLVGDKRNRTSFVETIYRTIKKYNFNGVDIDWEYPNEQGIGCNAINKHDSANFLAFLRLLRWRLGPKSRLSAAVSVRGLMSSDGQNYLTDLSEFAKVLDYLTIMAYDIYGSSFSEVAGPNSPLFDTCSDSSQKYSVAQAIHQWIKSGIPAHKLLLGIPAYGYSYTLKSSKLVPTHFSGKPGVTSKLFQKHIGFVKKYENQTDTCGSPDQDLDESQWLFKELIKTGKLSKDQKKGLNGYYRHWDKCTHTPFLFNPSTKNLISYDDSESLKQKTDYALRHGLAGVEMFDATGDTSHSQLLKSVRQVITQHEGQRIHDIVVE